MSSPVAVDPRYPDLAYPHPQSGYDWEVEQDWEPDLHDNGPEPYVLLFVARAAWEHAEIRETFLAEARYPGPILNDGKFEEPPDIGARMLDAFYAAYAERKLGRRKYTMMGIWRITNLVRVWAAGVVEPDDDEGSLYYVTPAPPPPPTPGQKIWRTFRAVTIILCLIFMALLLKDIITPGDILRLFR